MRKKRMQGKNYRHVRKKTKRIPKPKRTEIKEKDVKLGPLLWILIVLFLILWIIDLFKGGTYGYDYYPFRNLYNR